MLKTNLQSTNKEKLINRVKNLDNISDLKSLDIFLCGVESKTQAQSHGNVSDESRKTSLEL